MGGIWSGLKLSEHGVSHVNGPIVNAYYAVICVSVFEVSRYRLQESSERSGAGWGSKDCSMGLREFGKPVCFSLGLLVPILQPLLAVTTCK